MNIIKKVSLLNSIALFLLTPVFLMAQKGTTPLGEGQRVVIRKILNDDRQEYSSTIDLNDSRKQLLMAGQNYQTNYGIYASIEMSESAMGPNYKTLKKVDFEIVNYKPTYFIGIDSIIINKTKDLKGLTFKIYTRALSDKNSCSLREEDLKNIHFEEGSYLHSERILNPMFPEFDSKGKPRLMSDGSVACISNDGKAFDFEFFYKDGRYETRKEDYDKEKISTQMYKDEQAFTMPGKRCRQSFNKIMF